MSPRSTKSRSRRNGTVDVGIGGLFGRSLSMNEETSVTRPHGQLGSLIPLKVRHTRINVERTKVIRQLGTRVSIPKCYCGHN